MIYKKTPKEWASELEKATELKEFKNIAIDCQDDVMMALNRDKSLYSAYKEIVDQAEKRWKELKGKE